MLLAFSASTFLLIALTALVSSTAGALIYAGLKTYRQRRQPIGHRVDVFPAFGTPVGATCARSQLLLSDGQQSYSYADLRCVQIYISNEGDWNFDTFHLGLTLPAEAAVVFAEANSDDRNHQVKQITPISFAEPQSALDFVLLPLNRGDSYSLRLWVLLEEGKTELGPITFSSPQEVRFVQMPTIEEMLQETADLSSVGLGPIQLSFKALFK